MCQGDLDRLARDLEFILVDKAQVGSDVLRRINNARPRGGIMMYADIYRWFTETSGLGLAEQTARLMNPRPSGAEGGEWWARCLLTTLLLIAASAARAAHGATHASLD